MRPRRVVFRLELGGAAGWGHLARCSALAEELRRRGWTCTIWTGGDLAAAPDDLRAPFVDERAGSPGPGEAEWIVVDHYGVSDAGLRELRRSAADAHLLMIDDEAARALDAADVVLNPRLGLTDAPYASSRKLLGEHYALLRAGLRVPAKITTPFTAMQIPVLVMLGGTDPRGLAAPVIGALADVDVSRCVPIVVRSRALAGGDAMVRALDQFPRHVWLERLSATELAGWAVGCRCAVSACGGSLYELALLGLPFVGVVVAENQRAMAREVSARWRLPIVDAPGSERAAVAAGLRQLLAGSHATRTSLGGIDGLGAARVADCMEELRD